MDYLFSRSKPDPLPPLLPIAMPRPAGSGESTSKRRRSDEIEVETPEPKVRIIQKDGRHREIAQLKDTIALKEDVIEEMVKTVAAGAQGEPVTKLVQSLEEKKAALKKVVLEKEQSQKEHSDALEKLRLAHQSEIQALKRNFEDEKGVQALLVEPDFKDRYDEAVLSLEQENQRTTALMDEQSLLKRNLQALEAKLKEDALTIANGVAAQESLKASLAEEMDKISYLITERAIADRAQKDLGTVVENTRCDLLAANTKIRDLSGCINALRQSKQVEEELHQSQINTLETQLAEQKEAQAAVETALQESLAEEKRSNSALVKALEERRSQYELSIAELKREALAKQTEIDNMVEDLRKELEASSRLRDRLLLEAEVNGKAMKESAEEKKLLQERIEVLELENKKLGKVPASRFQGTSSIVEQYSSNKIRRHNVRSCMDAVTPSANEVPCADVDMENNDPGSSALSPSPPIQPGLLSPIQLHSRRFISPPSGFWPPRSHGLQRSHGFQSHNEQFNVEVSSSGAAHDQHSAPVPPSSGQSPRSRIFPELSGPRVSTEPRMTFSPPRAPSLAPCTSTTIVDTLNTVLTTVEGVRADLDEMKLSISRKSKAKVANTNINFKSEAGSRTRTAAHNTMMGHTRILLFKLLGITSDLQIKHLDKIHFVDPEISDAFEDGRGAPPSLEPLKIDWDVEKSQWNIYLSKLFAAYLTRNTPQMAGHESGIAAHFMQRIATMRACMNRNLPKEGETDAQCRERLAQTRAKTLKNKRIRDRQVKLKEERIADCLARGDSENDELAEMIMILGNDGNSSDESDGQGNRLVRNKLWRNRAIINRVALADANHSRTSIYGNNKPGGQRRRRIRRHNGPVSKQKIPIGKPINYYDTAMYNSLRSWEKEQLKAAPAIPFRGEHDPVDDNLFD